MGIIFYFNSNIPWETSASRQRLVVMLYLKTRRSLLREIETDKVLTNRDRRSFLVVVRWCTTIVLRFRNKETVVEV